MLGGLPDCQSPSPFHSSINWASLKELGKGSETPRCFLRGDGSMIHIVHVYTHAYIYTYIHMYMDMDMDMYIVHVHVHVYVYVYAYI